MMALQNQALSSAARDEIGQLLAAQSWQVPRGSYARGALARIILLPGERTSHGDFHTALVVQLIAADSALLANLPLTLHALEQAGITYYGRLDGRGALQLGLLPAGVYSARLPMITAVPGAIGATCTPPLRLERLAAPAAASDEQLPEHRFVSVGLPLTTTVLAHPQGVELCLEAQDPALDGVLVAIRWSSTSGAHSSGVQHGVLLAPLAWSETLGVCVAYLMLDVPATELELCLPEAPWPLVALTDELASVVRASLHCAARLHTQRAWQRLRAHAGLAPAVRAVLDELG